MHRKDLDTILMTAVIKPVVAKHHLQTAELYRYLRELRPEMDKLILQEAAQCATK